MLQQDLISAVLKFNKVHSQLFSGDIRMNELIAMGMIESSAPGDMVPTICEKLCITQSAVSQLLSSLEKKGYVKRLISESDKRKYVFETLPRGRQVTSAMLAEVERVIAYITSKFGEERLQTLIQMLNEFSDISEQSQNKKA